MSVRLALSCGPPCFVQRSWLLADYLGRELAFSDHDTRREYFRNGLIFGRADRNAAKSYLGFAEKLVTDFVDRTGAAAATIRTGFNRAAQNLPVNQVIEFFARPTAGRELIDAAIQLEGAAFAKLTPTISALPTEAKTLCLLIADYAGVDRRRLLGTTNSATATTTPNATAANSKSTLTRADGRLI